MAQVTYLTADQRARLQAAIARVEAQRPGLRQQDVAGWLDRVVYLCRVKDSSFGRKRNPSGRLSKNVLGVEVGGQQPPYFEAVDIARDDPGVNELRVPWDHYPPGPQSDEYHVGPDQAWVEQTTDYTDVSWDDAPVPGELPEGPTEDRLARIERRIDWLCSRFDEVFR